MARAILVALRTRRGQFVDRRRVCFIWSVIYFIRGYYKHSLMDALQASYHSWSMVVEFTAMISITHQFKALVRRCFLVHSAGTCTHGATRRGDGKLISIV